MTSEYNAFGEQRVTKEKVVVKMAYTLKISFLICMLFQGTKTTLGNTIQQKCHSQEAEILELRKTVAEMKLLVDSLALKLESSYTSLNERIDHEFDSVKKTMNSLSEKVDHSAVRSEHAVDFVGFTAIVSSDRSVSLGQTVVYDTVLQNYNGDYSGETGTFTCSVPGLYQFTVAVANVRGNDANVRVALMHNGNEQTRTFAEEIGFSNGSSAVVLQLAAGDTVRVQMVDGGGQISGSGYNSFAGVMVQLGAQ